MRPSFVFLAALLTLAACRDPGPTMLDPRFHAGGYNVKEIEFVAATPEIAASTYFPDANRLVPPMLVELLPRVPEYPPVSLRIEVTQAERKEREYSSYYIDKDGKEQGSKDVETTVSYDFNTKITLLEMGTDHAIGTTYVGHSVELDRYTRGSSLRENLFSSLLEGREDKVDPASFYLAYTKELIEELYPEHRARITTTTN